MNIDEHFQIFNGFRSKRVAVRCVFAIGVVCWANSCFLNLDWRPRVSPRSFVLSFGNFEPLDARPSSQCSSRTPLCFISILIAMTQPGYISNSFHVCFLQFCHFFFGGFGWKEELIVDDIPIFTRTPKDTCVCLCKEA